MYIIYVNINNYILQNNLILNMNLNQINNKKYNK